MNEIINRYMHNRIIQSGLKLTFVSQKTGISYQRLNRIFNQKAVMSGLELIKLSSVLNITQDELVQLAVGTPHA